MVAATLAQQRSNFFIRSRALLLFLVFVVFFALFLAAGIHYSTSTHFTVSDGNSLAISGAPGETITVTIDAGSSVEGDWATSGVTLSLNSLSSFSTQLVAPQDPNWSDMISTNGSEPDSEVLLSGSFTIPSDINTNTQSLTGTIGGNVLFPADEGFFYKNTLKALSIPVQLTLLNASTVFLSTQLPLYLATGLGALLLLALPAFFRLYDSRRLSPFISLQVNEEF